MGYIIRNDGSKVKKKKKEYEEYIVSKPFTYDNPNSSTFTKDIVMPEKKKGFGDYFIKPTFNKIVDFGKEAMINLDIAKRNWDNTPIQDKPKVAGMTALNTMRNIGEGSLNVIEQGIDAGADLFGRPADWINTKLEKAVGMHKGQSEKEVNEQKAQAKRNMIEQDTTGAFLRLMGDDPETQALYEENSLVKENNFGGQLAQNIGQQATRILIGKATGLNDTKSAAQYIPIAVTSYGSGVEEAYRAGATTSEARKYGLGNAATEIITEWATGGIPGVEGSKGGLDKLVEKMMGESLEDTSSSMAKYLIKKGYKLVGEGGEEVLANAINPFLKQFTYAYNNEKDLSGNISEAWANENLESMLNDFIMGAVSAGILEAPSSINEYNNIVNNNKINEQQSKPSQQQIKLPTVENNSQNSLNVPINENISANQSSVIDLPTVENANPLENLQKFSQRQEQVRNQQVQEDTNRRINTLEEQLEQQGNRILEESESQRKAMIESFKEYLEEHNITNPTQQDINDSITDIMSYDNDLDFADTARAEQLYNKYVKEYMQENGIPFNNGDSLKQSQLDIIKKSNPMQDDYHTGIRNVEDIKTLEETLNDSDYMDYDEFNPDLTRQDIENAIKSGMITVYSSYPIENGVFVSPSKMEAESYSGNGKIYSKQVPINDIAWIDPTQGQYAKVQSNIPTARDFNRVNLPTVEKNSDMVYNEGTGRRYNSIQEAIEADPRKAPYALYNKSVDFFNLDYNDMKKAIKLGSKYALEAQQFGLDKYSFNDDNYIYDIDIINEENNAFGITEMYKIDSEIGGIINEEYDIQNNRTSNESTTYDKTNGTEYSESTSKRETTINDVGLPRKKQESITTNENRQFIESKNTNNQRELENSSFSLPTKENNKTSMPMAKTDDVLRIASQNIAKQINGAGGFDLKQRSWVETATESDILKDKVYIEDLEPGKISYVVQSNKKSLDSANKHLETYGYDKTLDYVKNIMQSDKLPSASDVALMQRMIQEASKRGDAETVQDLIMDTAIVGTDLGQATQALSIIQKLTPEGQLKMYTKLVQRAKARGEKSFQNVEITPEMVQNILEAYDKNGNYDQDDLNARVEKFKQDIADQMKTTVGEKIDAWRYLSMLGNPKTHIRNMVSNIAMTGTIKVKNAMARTLETVLPVKNRTKTWKAASQDIKEYSRKTANDMKGIITGENKYNEKSAIESKKQIFKSKVLEKLSTLNGNALEGEDWFFSKRAFQNTLQEYLTANGINTYEDIQNNPEIVEKAKLYAVEQAEIATFRQYSKLASEINKIERKNKGARLAIQALVPFKKTPINVAKAGVNYSPLGLSKNLTYDLWQLTHGNMEASQFIDKLSQGLTGTSLTLLGYALAKAGILTGSGGDDKDDKYDKQLGKTGYSLNIGGKSYSISWLSPVAMPLLVGSNAYEQLEEQKEWDMNVVSDTLAKTLDPLNEMSFMQGLTNALNSYGSGVDKWKGALESTGQNYVGQFFPTLFSQIAATTDDKKRSTKASNNSKYKFGEQTVRSVMYKIPGLRQQLEVATDVWGNEKKQSSNIIERAFESFIAPYTKTEDISTKLDKEIKRVYNETGETGVIPGIPNSYVKYKDETYRMSANEYTDYKKTYGQTAYNTLNKLTNSNDYKQATDEDKVKMLEDVYKYARGKANQEYFDSNNIDYENDLLDKLDTLNNRYGISANTYFANKKEYDYAYQNPDKYSVIKQITSYEKYTAYKDRITDIRNNTTNDKDETIKYINSLSMSIPQKAMFIKQYYKSFKSYDKQIIEYINSQKLTKNEKEQILTQLGFTVRNGRVY